ncbi:YncE family protein [Kitasatospora purpeofusca]|uniref:YncE family protein n=1 Tax=Kitasatospora purpeofusca TaxID=67352 RepID=UPI0036D214C0
MITLDDKKGATLQSAGTQAKPGDVAVPASWSCSDDRIYMSAPEKNQIYVWKDTLTTNPQVDSRWDAGPRPTRLAVDPRGRWVYAINDGCATVTVVRADTGGFVTKLPVGTDSNLIAVSSCGTRLCVASPVSGTVSVFDTDSQQIVEVADPVWVGAKPSALALSPDGGRLFVALDGSKHLVVVDTAGPEPIVLPETIPLGDGVNGAGSGPELPEVPVALVVTKPSHSPQKKGNAQ